MSLYAAWPLLGLWRRCGDARDIAILMYHSVSDTPEQGIRDYYRLNTPPGLFRDQMHVIKTEGFAVADLVTALKMLEERGGRSAEAVGTPDMVVPPAPPFIPRSTQPATAPPRLAVITFDDGYQDFLAAAWPILSDFGFPATVFLPTQFIGSPRRSFKGRECLTWDEVRELRRQGARFGSHTVTHPNLAALGELEFENELADSKRKLEYELGETIETFAHPYGFPRTDRQYVARYKESLARQGYKVAVTTLLGRAGLGEDPLLVRRLPVNGADDCRLFAAKLHGAYDWLAAPQTALKRLKHGALRCKQLLSRDE